MLRCIVVDDEPTARLGIERYLNRIENAIIVGSAGNVSDLQPIIRKENADLIFLDINMPGTSGIEFLKTASELPAIIIITAYPDFALDGYELNLVDYLVKPVSFERFIQAFKKAERFCDTGIAASNEQDHLFIHSGGRFEKVVWRDILYFESLLNYVRVVTQTKSHVVYSSLKGIEALLPRQLFLRIHKSYIIALSHVTALEGSFVFIGKTELPISRAQKTQVYEVLIKGKTI